MRWPALLALVVAMPVNAQVVSSINAPSGDTSGLQTQITNVQTTANAAVKKVGGSGPDGSGNVALPTTFSNTSCLGCGMSNPVFTGVATLNGIGLATASDITGVTTSYTNAIAAIVFPVTSVNGSTGAVTVPVYTDAQAISANSTAITNATNLATAAVKDVVQVVSPASGATVTPSAGTTVLFINNATLLAALTVTFPASPSDGQRFTVCANSVVTTLGFTGATSRGAASTLAANGYARFVWSSSVSVWFRAG